MAAKFEVNKEKEKINCRVVCNLRNIYPTERRQQDYRLRINDYTKVRGGDDGVTPGSFSILQNNHILFINK